MNFLPQIDALFSHVVSQLSYKWLPLEPVGKNFPRNDYTGLTLRFFHEYVFERWNPANPPAVWMAVTERRGMSKSVIATMVYEQIQQTQDAGARLLDYFHPLYPALLRHIADPPNVLMALGDIELLKAHLIAVVGARKASQFALKETHKVARLLAQEGSVVVSGGALGCDIAAHSGATIRDEKVSRTIVVFANGLSRLYPRCHKAHFEEMRAHGALFLSERLWDFPARPIDFPSRNRIISGLTNRILVMQAGLLSGAGITANIALDQGREVFVLVHPRDDVRAQGSDMLIEDGAMPFYSAYDYFTMPYPWDRL